MRRLEKVVRTKRQGPVKRLREPSRMSRSEVFRVKPDRARPFIVMVWVSPSRNHMHVTADRVEGGEYHDRRAAGLVKSYTLRNTGKPCVRPGKVIARMFLNRRDLAKAPCEILAHECGHAAMAWARFQKANLKIMDGEEVMCYALGRMFQKLANILDTRGYFAR